MNIRQVAAKAKVSVATISRTINRSELVDAKTAEKVWRVIRQLKYYPNGQARALVLGKSRMFGLIISDISNPFFPELVKSFDDAAMQHNYEVLVANTDYKSERMGIAVRRMIERKVDGVAIMTSELDRDLLTELYRRRLPLVFLDLGNVQPLVSRVVVDYRKGIAEAIRHLVSLGHQRIAFISGPLVLKSARTRRTAFLGCMRESGIPAGHQMEYEGNHRVDGGDVAMRSMLSQPNRPTAVLASNDLMAIGAMRAITAMGLEVPRDISVIGFDDIEFSQYIRPRLTTIRLSREDLGRKAFDALYRTAEGLAKRGQEIHMGTTLVLRETTGPPAREAAARLPLLTK
jgi:LacI family transcriptional regulator